MRRRGRWGRIRKGFMVQVPSHRAALSPRQSGGCRRHLLSVFAGAHAAPSNELPFVDQ